MTDWPNSCGTCGAEFHIDYVTGIAYDEPNYCPYCGGEL